MSADVHPFIPHGPRNLVDALLDHLETAAARRERLRMAVASMPAGKLATQFAVEVDRLTAAIAGAKAAIGGQDVIASLRAYHHLEALTHAG